MNTEELEKLDEAEVEEEATTAAPGEAEAEGAEPAAKEAEEIIVQIGDDEPEDQERAPDWVRELRKSNREKDKRIKELEAAQTEKPKLGAKPTLESCDYDNAAFEDALEKWHNAKRQADDAERAQKDAQQRQEQAWNAKLRGYEEAKAKLKVPDYEDVEATVLETFNVTQQGIVVQGAENPALLAYALGKNPTRAKALAAITDPIEFAFAVAKVEASLKVTAKGPPPPEKRLQSSTPGISATVDGALERLREEAAKTGDYSKVMAYKRQKRG